ncbi:putative kinase [Lachnospiraceae bacterium KM106-2]|nr:putative kinase [Lachnospiraceae bacterium KM106-2]
MSEKVQLSKIIILRGNSGSGKTTTAKALQKRLGHGTMLLSQDVIRREMLYVKDGPDTPAVNLLIDLVQYAKKQCSIVILEGILSATWYAELFERIKTEYQDQIYAYYFDLPFEETLQRHKQKPNAKEFGEAEMRRWWKEKDFIHGITESILTKDQSQEEILEQIVKNSNLENRVAQNKV